MHDNPRIDRNRLPLSTLAALLEAGYLITDYCSSIDFEKENAYTIHGFYIPMPLFRAFLKEQSPNIVFEGGKHTLQFILDIKNDKSVIRITTKLRGKFVETVHDGSTFVDEPGIPNVVFCCDVGGNPSGRSALATYEHLYKLFEFLQEKLVRK